jgi:hypothetical protein
MIVLLSTAVILIPRKRYLAIVVQLMIRYTKSGSIRGHLLPLLSFAVPVLGRRVAPGLQRIGNITTLYLALSPLTNGLQHLITTFPSLLKHTYDVRNKDGVFSLWNLNAIAPPSSAAPILLRIDIQVSLWFAWIVGQYRWVPLSNRLSMSSWSGYVCFLFNLFSF